MKNLRALTRGRHQIGATGHLSLRGQVADMHTARLQDPPTMFITMEAFRMSLSDIPEGLILLLTN